MRSAIAIADCNASVRRRAVLKRTVQRGTEGHGEGIAVISTRPRSAARSRFSPLSVRHRVRRGDPRRLVRRPRPDSPRLGTAVAKRAIGDQGPIRKNHLVGALDTRDNRRTFFEMMLAMAAAGLIETIEIQDGVRRYTVIRPRVRYPDLPVSRLGVALEVADLAAVLAGLPAEERRAATTLLKQGLGRWRRWSTILRRPPRQVDVRLAERELIPALLRAGALAVRERYDAADGRWRLDAFRTDEVHAEALGRPDPDRLATALMAELTHTAPRAALAAGRPPSLSLEAFAFVLRAADRWLELCDHGRRPQDRELAALVWHSKAFTPVRARHVAEIVGVAPDELFEPRPRQLICDGPLLHPNATIWADAVQDLPLEPTGELRGIVCIENSRTFEALRPYARLGWLLIHVPGNAPSAEVVLLSRAAALSPGTGVLAAFDPDPAGIRIALSLARRSDVALDPLLMGADSLRHATKLPLADWDREELARLHGRSVGPHRPLLDEIEKTDAKGEQEAMHGWLRARLDALTSAASAPPAAAGPPAAS